MLRGWGGRGGCCLCPESCWSTAGEALDPSMLKRDSDSIKQKQIGEEMLVIRAPTHLAMDSKMLSNMEGVLGAVEVEGDEIEGMTVAERYWFGA